MKRGAGEGVERNKAGTFMKTKEKRNGRTGRGGREERGERREGERLLSFQEKRKKQRKAIWV